MTDDPRTAALAEVLFSVLAIPYHDGTDHADCAACGEPVSESSLREFSVEIAPAILAALPPDWCGHRPRMHHTVVAPPGYSCDDCDEDRAEIACLRRIEEAAREVMDDCEVEARGEGCGPHDALRAALEEKP